MSRSGFGEFLEYDFLLLQPAAMCGIHRGLHLLAEEGRGRNGIDLRAVPEFCRVGRPIFETEWKGDLWVRRKKLREWSRAKSMG